MSLQIFANNDDRLADHRQPLFDSEKGLRPYIGMRKRACACVHLFLCELLFFPQADRPFFLLIPFLKKFNRPVKKILRTLEFFFRL